MGIPLRRGAARRLRRALRGDQRRPRGRDRAEPRGGSAGGAARPRCSRAATSGSPARTGGSSTWRRLPGVADAGGHGELPSRASRGRASCGAAGSATARRARSRPAWRWTAPARSHVTGGVHGRDPAWERREPHDVPEALRGFDAARRAGQLSDLRGSRSKEPAPSPSASSTGGLGARRARLRRRHRDGRAPPRRARRAARERERSASPGVHPRGCAGRAR